MDITGPLESLGRESCTRRERSTTRLERMRMSDTGADLVDKPLEGRGGGDIGADLVDGEGAGWGGG